MEKKLPLQRISASIGLPSPSLQAFLKKIIFDNEAYLVFLENTKGSMNSHGIGFADDVTEKQIIDFHFTIDRIRNAVLNSDKKLQFEDIFRVPVLHIEGGQMVATAPTATNVYYSETRTEENRGTSTEFDPKTQAVSSKSTETQHTTKFNGTSIFNHNIRERFERTPLISAEVLMQLVKAVSIRI